MCFMEKFLSDVCEEEQHECEYQWMFSTIECILGCRSNYNCDVGAGKCHVARKTHITGSGGVVYKFCE